jgi:hypothetical protein
VTIQEGTEQGEFDEAELAEEERFTSSTHKP